MYAVCKLFQPSTYKYQVTSGLDSLAIANEVHQRARWSSKQALRTCSGGAARSIPPLERCQSRDRSTGFDNFSANIRRVSAVQRYNMIQRSILDVAGDQRILLGEMRHVFNVRAAFKSEMSGSRPYQGVELRGFWIYVDWEFGVPVQFMQFMQPRLFFRCS